MPVNIHGKQYYTVAERLQEAREDIVSVETTLISSDPIVVIQAKVTTKKGIFMGISGANPSKSIEKASPYEVAETSAVGRALGFAGYGAVDGIASADEMVKAGAKVGDVREKDVINYEAEPFPDNQAEINRQKEEIKTHLKRLGASPKTKAETERLVEELTGFSLREENYGKIITALQGLPK